MSLIMKEIVGNVIDAFEQNKVEYAYKTEPLEELVDIYCDEMKMNHVKRVQKGECTLHQGFIFNDLLTDFERIADHCSNVAVAIIELELNVLIHMSILLISRRITELILINILRNTKKCFL